mgnify:FL=1
MVPGSNQASTEAIAGLEDVVLTVGGAIVTRGQKIQIEAIKDARGELVKERAEAVRKAEEEREKKKKNKLSRGQAVYIRRHKANERRGTDPRLIH